MEKIQLKKEMIQIIVTMQSQQCLFQGKVMKDCKSLFFLSKKYASFCYNKVFHIFCLRDFVKMIWKVILRNSVPLAEGVITQLFVISAIMAIQSSYIFSKTNCWKCSRTVGKFNRISDEPLPKRKVALS